MDPLEPTALRSSRDGTAKATIAISESARRSVLVAAILASSMGFIDGSVVALAVPAIRDDLGASLVDAQWINNAYLLFLSALVLIGGSAGDVFGARKVFALGIGLIHGDLARLRGSRRIRRRDPDAWGTGDRRGAHGAGIAVDHRQDLSAASARGSDRNLGRFLVADDGGRTGPGRHAALVRRELDVADDLRDQRAVGLVALFLLLRRVPSDPPSTRRSLDWTGAVLATLGLGFVAWGLNEYGVRPEERVLAPLPAVCGGLLALLLFVVWERIARQPMVRLGLFREWAFAGANVYTLVLFLAFNAVLFFLPMTLITAWSVTEWQVSATCCHWRFSSPFFRDRPGGWRTGSGRVCR